MEKQLHLPQNHSSGGAKKEKNRLQKYLEKFLTTLLRNQNPDFDKNINEVIAWLLEFQDKKSSPIREIGINKNGDAIIKMPYKNNYGYWTDNNLQFNDFIQRFNYQEGIQKDFEKSWNNVLI